MSVIDFHSHVWPDEIAARALGNSIPEMPLRGDGTVAGLRSAQVAAGIDRSVCLGVAPRPERVRSTNAFLGGLDRAHFVPFGTAHPALPVAENLAILREHGLAGVKLHPTFQQFRLDDPDVLALLAGLAGEFPVVLHVGAGAGSDGHHATPAMVREIVRAVPDLTLVACHFGGYHHLDAALETLVGEPVYLDTSWPPSVGGLGRDVVRRIVDQHGADRVVFASDWPTADPATELSFLDDLGLDAESLALVRGGNAARILAR